MNTLAFVEAILPSVLFCLRVSDTPIASDWPIILRGKVCPNKSKRIRSFITHTKLFDRVISERRQFPDYEFCQVVIILVGFFQLKTDVISFGQYKTD